MESEQKQESCPEIDAIQILEQCDDEPRLFYNR